MHTQTQRYTILAALLATKLCRATPHLEVVVLGPRAGADPADRRDSEQLLLLAVRRLRLGRRRGDRLLRQGVSRQGAWGLRVGMDNRSYVGGDLA